MTRTVGVLLLVAGVGVCLVASAFLGVSVAGGNLTVEGAVLGLVLLFVVVAPLVGGGIFVMRRSRLEEAEKGEADLQRKILDVVEARGEVSVSDVIVETQTDFQTVKDAVYKLVGMGVFSGYANWEEGRLYSSSAADLHAISKCRNCGGEMKLVGKGVQQCPHCGTDYFLAS